MSVSIIHLRCHDERSQVDGNELAVGDAGLLNGKHDADPEFFDRIKFEAKKAFKSEQAEEQRKAREVNKCIL